MLKDTSSSLSILPIQQSLFELSLAYSTGSSSSSNNLLEGSSITKSGLHRGPNTRYILYIDTITTYKLELKPK